MAEVTAVILRTMSMDGGACIATATAAHARHWVAFSAHSARAFHWWSLHRSSNSSSRIAQAAVSVNDGACIASSAAAHAQLRDDALDRATATRVACTSSSNINEGRSLHCISSSSSRIAARRRARSCNTATTAACVSSSNINEWRSLHCGSNRSSRTAARRRARSCNSNDGGVHLEQQYQ